MKCFTKTVSLLAIIMGIPSVFAATNARISATTTATRFPTIAGRMSSVATGIATTTGVTTTASLLDSAECIDSYTSCMKGSEACGPDFEECTTNVLFHGKMPQCFSTLYQCSSAGINNLFGTSAITSLGNIKSQNTAGEVTAYTYPTDGSVLGQLISGSAISNRYDAADCVKKYKKCLYKESVCGEDFELCTSDSEFRKQSVFCDSVLGRCQSDGVNQLFGQTNSNSGLIKQAGRPNGAGSALVKQWMEDGADLAAANAVQTCYKIIDNCFMNACAANPLRCVEGTNLTIVGAADFIANGTESVVDMSTGVDTQDASAIKKFFKSSCMDTIGKNKYCHMTFKETATVKASELADIDEQEDVFSDAFTARKSNLNSKLQDIVTKFDTKAKDKCRDTIVSCAMKMCGDGVGSLCYSDVFVDGDKTINGKNSYDPIATGCAGVVNLDANCKYAAATTKAAGYAYTYNDADTFSILFPKYEGSSGVATAIAQQNDPVGAIGTLNGKLSSSYNEAAIADLKKQCQNVAVSCVRSMCGKDYVNCYRNRTDIVAGTYDTGSASFDRSMNKMGGVLDYNIVIGLCLQTVQNSATCEEHLKIAGATWRRNNANDSALWGSSVRNSWLGGNTTTVEETQQTIVTGCTVKEESDSCNTYTVKACGTVDEDGCLYDQEQTESVREYALKNSATTLFQQVLVDIEKEAQAKYNAKLTKEQNVCLANNNGGIQGVVDNGSTFMWVKLKSKKTPGNYSIKGLTDKQIVASNDLYGSFCRARVHILSDDKQIQDTLGDDSYAYFAVGDAFTCGSWISQDKLDKITEKVGEKARKEAGEGSQKEKMTYAWSVIGGLLGGGAIGTGLSESGAISGLLNKADTKMGMNKTNEDRKKECAKFIKSAKSAVDTNSVSSANSYAKSALKSCKDLAGKDSCPSEEITWYTDSAAVVNGSTVDDFNKAISNIRYVCNSCTDTTKQAAKTSCLDSISKAENSTNTSEIRSSELAKASTQCKVIDPGNTMCAAVAYSEGTVTTAAKTNNKDEFLSYVSEIENVCSEAADVSAADAKRNKAIRIAVPLATAAAGGALGAGITASVLKTKYEKAENEAIAAWMEEVGEHIKCYLGSEELGSYGDVVTFELN